MSQLAKSSEMTNVADATAEILASEPDGSSKSFDSAVLAKSREETSAVKRKFQLENDSLKNQIKALEKERNEEKNKRMKLERTLKNKKEGSDASPKHTRGPAKGADQTNQSGKNNEDRPVPHSNSQNRRRRSHGKNERVEADDANNDANTERNSNQSKHSKQQSKRRRNKTWRKKPHEEY